MRKFYLAQEKRHATHYCIIHPYRTRSLLRILHCRGVPVNLEKASNSVSHCRGQYRHTVSNKSDSYRKRGPPTAVDRHQRHGRGTCFERGGYGGNHTGCHISGVNLCQHAMIRYAHFLFAHTRGERHASRQSLLLLHGLPVLFIYSSVCVCAGVTNNRQEEFPSALLCTGTWLLP